MGLNRMPRSGVRRAKNPRGTPARGFGSIPGMSPAPCADPMNSASAPTAPAVSQQNVSEKNFSPLVKQFLDYLKLERHFSDYTVKSYGADLIQFGQFLSGQIGATAQS